MSRDSGELRPQLREAQETLGVALKEACSMDPAKANTGELIQIEELLAIANDSAKKAISVRRRLKKDGKARSETAKPRPTEYREFLDAASVRWTAIAVHPSTSKSLTGAFQNGWLSFDNGTETRRHAPIPENWRSLSDDDLRRLCESATVASRRQKK
jgi:hypothetical protein